ncbi:GntR family transcriptional regulator [Polaromonas hydrogenivorans]|uniref:GntR family transcriptional regulator n=1 Tax=Polaromonas hydrogenivorans TaxID=335476 RepID=A0AAU7M017_9BURK
MPTQPYKQSAAKFIAGATTLYAQLASVLRSRILNGEWRSGENIPSIDELCSQYRLGRITVRQALQILSGEGLLSSQRGRRTFVTYSAGNQGGMPIFSSLASVETKVPNYSIRILSRSKVADLPVSRWAIGRDEGPYMHIRKVDHEGEQPYGLSSIYLVEDVYKRFPRNAESRSKLAQLVLQFSKPALATARERLTVEPADYEAAGHLAYPMAAPVARVERVFCDTAGRVLYYGTTIYRGDRFCLERDLTEYLRSKN